MKLDNKLITIIISVFFVFLIGIIIYINGDSEELEPTLVIDNKINSLVVGKNYQINAHVENYDNAIIEWNSNDNNILSIKDGIMTANSSGTAIVTAFYKHRDGTLYEDKFVVKVVDDAVDISSISFEEGDLLISLNNTYNINSIINISPSDETINEKRYYSSNTSVLEVDNQGIIKCKNSGKSNILVEYNKDFSANKDVYCINKNVNTKLVTIPKQIDVYDVELSIDETKQVKYSISPSNAYSDYLTFSSSNSSIFSIDDSGVIKGIKAGQATVIVSSLNGVEGLAKVVVKSNIIPVNSITLSKESIELTSGNKTEIGVTISPSNATNQDLYISSSNNSVAVGYLENNKLMVVGIKTGDAVITVKCDNKTKIINVKVNSSSSTIEPYTTPPIPVVITSPNIISTGTIDSSLLSNGSNEGFNSCRNVSPHLTLKSNGTTIGQDGKIKMKVGQSIRLEAYLPTKCGEIINLTRTSADGSSNWQNLVFQSNDPHVDRYDSSTFRSGVRSYKWTITAFKSGSIIVSQTAQFNAKAPSGSTANIKSMIRLHLDIVN